MKPATPTEFFYEHEKEWETMKPTTPTEFFYEHAGYSYDPLTETPEQGRRRCAETLASAEQWARDNGYSFEWIRDPYTTSADWIKDNDDGGENCFPWHLWTCIIHDADGNDGASLHGIDFGRDGEPWGDPYRRVVEAELALESMPA